jgi:hypothetical protein
MPFSKNTKDAPTAVTNHVKDVANNACNIGFNSINGGITIKISKQKYCNFKISNSNHVTDYKIEFLYNSKLG